jgi:hypothetical protein
VTNFREHTLQVNRWIGKATKGKQTEGLIDLFERAMLALWRRAEIPLGQVTIAAIADRVISGVEDQFPQVQFLRITPTGIDFQELHAQAGKLGKRQVIDGMRVVIVEFMAVIGNLTAEILTPALHLELSKVSIKNQASGSKHGKGKS